MRCLAATARLTSKTHPSNHKFEGCFYVETGMPPPAGPFAGLCGVPVPRGWRTQGIADGRRASGNVDGLPSRASGAICPYDLPEGFRTVSVSTWEKIPNPCLAACSDATWCGLTRSDALEDAVRTEQAFPACGQCIGDAMQGQCHINTVLSASVAMVTVDAWSSGSAQAVPYGNGFRHRCGAGGQQQRLSI